MAMNIKSVVNSVKDAARDGQRVAAARKVLGIAEERTTLMIRMNNYESLEDDFWKLSGVPESGRGCVRDAYTVLLKENAEHLREAVEEYYGI